MLGLLSVGAHASGVLPETSVVIVEQGDGEGAINVKNSDAFPVLLLTTLIDIPEDPEALLIVTPPAARVEAGKTQRVRFIMASKEPLKTERLKRVVFDGVPPQKKGQNKMRMTVRQNLPVIIRPAGLARDLKPWEHLTWRLSGNTLTVNNPSPYVVRLEQSVQTLPDKTAWVLPRSYVLPGQTISVSAKTDADLSKKTSALRVRISPATTWGYSVESYETALSP